MQECYGLDVIIAEIGQQERKLEDINFLSIHVNNGFWKSRNILLTSLLVLKYNS